MTIHKLYRNMALVLCSCLTLINTSFAALPSSCHINTPAQMTERYTDLKDGTALDTATGLIWQRCNLGQSWNTNTESCQSFVVYKNWRDSLTSIQNYNADQYAAGLADDWRMPNIKELASIMNLNCVNYAIDIDVFPNAAPAYWSSTPNAANVRKKDIPDENNVLIGYQYENYIWTISTFTGKEEYKILSSTMATLMVRGPVAP